MKAIPSDRALRVFRYVLAVTALWTLMGAVPGYLDPAASFQRFSGAPAESPIVLELYRGVGPNAALRNRLCGGLRRPATPPLGRGARRGGQVTLRRAHLGRLLR